MANIYDTTCLFLVGPCFDRLRETQLIVLNWQWRVSKPLTLCTSIFVCCEMCNWVTRCNLLPNIVIPDGHQTIHNPLWVNPFIMKLGPGLDRLYVRWTYYSRPSQSFCDINHREISINMWNWSFIDNIPRVISIRLCSGCPSSGWVP